MRLSQSGQLEEARGAAAKVLRINPGFTIESSKRILVYKYSKDLEHYVDGMCKAGLPES
jgi:adenylate cyclase